MQRSPRAAATLLAVALTAPVAPLLAQGSNLAISPFVSFLPSAGASPLAGLALTLGGSGGFALRGSAQLALENSNKDTSIPSRGSARPWSADADALFLFGAHGGGRGGYGSVGSIAPFAFVGLGTKTTDDAGFNVTTHNWSYGAGASIALGSAVDLFGEGRWRMSRYVLPTASMAPSPTTEVRFGVSFHVGSNGSNDARRTRGRRSNSRGE